MYDKWLVDFGTRILSSDPQSFYNWALAVLVFAFIMRLIFKKSSFEYLKIIVIIIIFTVSLNFTLSAFKDELRRKAEDRIILIKQSSFNSIEIDNYLINANNTINELSSDGITHLPNMIYGTGLYFLWAMFLIIIRDLLLLTIWNKLMAFFTRMKKE